MQQIQETKENDLIVAVVLADQIYRERYEKSSKKVCKDLGIDYISA